MKSSIRSGPHRYGAIVSREGSRSTLAQLIDNASSIDSPIEIAFVSGGNADIIAAIPSRVPLVAASRTSSRS